MCCVPRITPREESTTKEKITFPEVDCCGCDCYSTQVLPPFDIRLCTGGKWKKRGRRFRASDPQHKAPKWCPKRLPVSVCRIYGFADEMSREMETASTTIQHKDWDQRFSRDNKAWAQTVPMEASFGSRENDHSVYYVVDQAHSGLTDLFVSHFRKEQVREKEQPKKESILGKLQKPLPEPASKAGKDKSHER